MPFDPNKLPTSVGFNPDALPDKSKKENWKDLALNIGKKALEEISLNQGGELAGMAAALVGGDYVKTRDQFDADVTKFEEEHQVLSPTITAGTIGAQIALSGGLGAPAIIAKQGFKAGIKQAAKAGLVGSAIGATGNFGDAKLISEEGITPENIAKTAESVKEGAITGGALGVAGKYAGDAVGAAATAIKKGIESVQKKGVKNIADEALATVYNKSPGKLRKELGDEYLEKTAIPLQQVLEKRGTGSLKSLRQLENIASEEASEANKVLDSLALEGAKEGLGVSKYEFLQQAIKRAEKENEVSTVRKALNSEIQDFSNLTPKQFLDLSDIKKYKTAYASDVFKKGLSIPDRATSKAKEIMREVADDLLYKAASASKNLELPGAIKASSEHVNSMLNNVNLLSKAQEADKSLLGMTKNVSPYVVGWLIGGLPGAATAITASTLARRYGSQAVSSALRKSEPAINKALAASSSSAGAAKELARGTSRFLPMLSTKQNKD